MTESLSGGVAYLTNWFLPVGANNFTASYGGSSGFGASSKSLTETVNKAATTTVVAASPDPVSVGQWVTLTAQVTPV